MKSEGKLLVRPLTSTQTNRRTGRKSTTSSRQFKNSTFITIHDLEIWCKIGVSETERQRPQRLLITVEMQIDFSPVGSTDDVAKTVDYASVAEAIKREAVSRPRKLVETLTEDIARRILDSFDVREITVKLEKFPFKDARSVSVKITRSQYA